MHSLILVLGIGVALCDLWMAVAILKHMKLLDKNLLKLEVRPTARSFFWVAVSTLSANIALTVLLGVILLDMRR